MKPIVPGDSSRRAAAGGHQQNTRTAGVDVAGKSSYETVQAVNVPRFECSPFPPAHR